jgi:hypothetical protein
MDQEALKHPNILNAITFILCTEDYSDIKKNLNLNLFLDSVSHPLSQAMGLQAIQAIGKIATHELEEPTSDLYDKCINLLTEYLSHDSEEIQGCAMSILGELETSKQAKENEKDIQLTIAQLQQPSQISEEEQRTALFNLARCCKNPENHALIIQLKGLEALVSLIDPTDSQRIFERDEPMILAIESLATLALNKENYPAIIEKNVFKIWSANPAIHQLPLPLKALTTFIKQADDYAQIQKALDLTHFITHAWTISPELSQLLIQATIKIAEQETKNSDLSLYQECINLLKTFTKERPGFRPNDTTQICAKSGLEHLTKLQSSHTIVGNQSINLPNKEVPKHGIRELDKLSALKEKKEQEIRLHLARLKKPTEGNPENERLQNQSIQILDGYAMNRQYRTLIIRLGGLEALKSLVHIKPGSSPSDKMLCVCNILAALALDKENYPHIVQSDVLKILSSTDDFCSSPISLFAIVAFIIDTNDYAQIQKSVDLNNFIRIASTTTDPDFAKMLIKATIKIAEHELVKPDTQLYKNCMALLTNFAQQSENFLQLDPAFLVCAISELEELKKQHDENTDALSHRGNSANDFGESGAKNDAVDSSTITSHNPGMAPGCERGELADLEAPKPIHQEIKLAIMQLRQSMYANEQAQQTAIDTLAIYSASPDNHHLIIEHGGLNALISLIRRGTEHSLPRAITTFGSLVLSKDNYASMIQADIFKTLSENQEICTLPTSLYALATFILQMEDYSQIQGAMHLNLFIPNAYSPQAQLAHTLMDAIIKIASYELKSDDPTLYFQCVALLKSYPQERAIRGIEYLEKLESLQTHAPSHSKELDNGQGGGGGSKEVPASSAASSRTSLFSPGPQLPAQLAQHSEATTPSVGQNP